MQLTLGSEKFNQDWVQKCFTIDGDLNFKIEFKNALNCALQSTLSFIKIGFEDAQNHALQSTLDLKLNIGLKNAWNCALQSTVGSGKR